MNSERPRTWGTEDVPGEYHGPALRSDLHGIRRVLEAALEDRRKVVEHAGGSLAADAPARDIMRALEATGTLTDMAQRLDARPNYHAWGESHG